MGFYRPLSLRDDVKQDGEVMEQAAGQNKQVPDGMMVRHGFSNIEEGAAGIRQAAGQ